MCGKQFGKVSRPKNFTICRVYLFQIIKSGSVNYHLAREQDETISRDMSLLISSRSQYHVTCPFQSAVGSNITWHNRQPWPNHSQDLSFKCLLYYVVYCVYSLIWFHHDLYRVRCRYYTVVFCVCLWTLWQAFDLWQTCALWPRLSCVSSVWRAKRANR